MKNRILKILDGVIESISYGIICYVLISMEMSFRRHWFSILFPVAIIWATYKYWASIQKLTENKVITGIIWLCNIFG